MTLHKIEGWCSSSLITLTLQVYYKPPHIAIALAARLARRAHQKTPCPSISTRSSPSAPTILPYTILFRNHAFKSILESNPISRTNLQPHWMDAEYPQINSDELWSIFPPWRCFHNWYSQFFGRERTCIEERLHVWLSNVSFVLYIFCIILIRLLHVWARLMKYIFLCALYIHWEPDQLLFCSFVV